MFIYYQEDGVKSKNKKAANSGVNLLYKRYRFSFPGVEQLGRGVH
jgi:hypothetical protein